MILVIVAIAIVNPIHKFKQHLERHHRFTAGNALLGMHRTVAQLDDKAQLAPSIVFQRMHKARLMNQCLQIVLIRHLHGGIGGIHPLYRKLQRLAAPHRTHCRRCGIDFFRLNTSRRKKRKFLLVC